MKSFESLQHELFMVPKQFVSLAHIHGMTCESEMFPKKVWGLFKNFFSKNEIKFFLTGVSFDVCASVLGRVKMQKLLHEGKSTCRKKNDVEKVFLTALMLSF